MLLSSFARAASADDLDTMCSTAQTQYLNNLQKEIADSQALLAQATDEDSKDLLAAKLIDLREQLEDMNAVNCP
jgi:hypothetical protein